VFLIISDERLRQGTVNNSGLDEEISKSIVKWMKGCITLLDKEKVTDTDKISKLFLDMLKSSDKVVKKASDILNLQEKNIKEGKDVSKATELIEVGIKREFGAHSNQSLVDILLGIMHLSKGNYAAIKPLCLKLGAFPEGDKFAQIFKSIVKFRAFLNEPQDIAGKVIDEAKEKIQEKADEGQQAVMSKTMRTIGHDPEKLFDIIDKD
jgi:hypothetical protein